MINFIIATAGALLVCLTDIKGQEVGQACGTSLSHAAQHFGLEWAKADKQARHDGAQAIANMVDMGISVRCGNNKECTLANQDMAGMLAAQVFEYSDSQIKKVSVTK